MQQSFSGDNPQPSELIWLAGFIDGEGTFGLNVHTRKDRNKLGLKQCTPRMIVANTSMRTVEYIDQIMKDWRIPHLVRSRKQYSDKHRPQKQIVVMGYKRVVRLLDIVRPECLYTKRTQAKLLKVFCDYRIAEYGKRGKMCGMEDEVHAMLRELNQSEGSTTIMAASQLIHKITEKMG